MKRVLTIVAITLLSVGLFSYLEGNNYTCTAEEELVAEQLSGLWKDSNRTLNNAYAIFSVEGSQLEMMHYLESGGKAMVEKGRGKLIGRRLDYFVVVTKQIPGWAMTGEHFLTLSNDGRTLRGAYEDEKGNVGPLVFKKVGK